MINDVQLRVLNRFKKSFLFLIVAGYEEEAKATFLMSRYGQPVVEYEGFRYNIHPGYKSEWKIRKLWACSRTSSGCRVKLYTVGNKIVEIRGEHCHVVKKLC